jgi:ethanolamine utilization cobalamin adenosyltransferase
MTREEPSLETLWLKIYKHTHTRKTMMDKVQITDHSNTAPSSKTFRDELNLFIIKDYVNKLKELAINVIRYYGQDWMVLHCSHKGCRFSFFFLYQRFVNSF